MSSTKPVSDKQQGQNNQQMNEPKRMGNNRPSLRKTTGILSKISRAKRTSTIASGRISPLARPL